MSSSPRHALPSDAAILRDDQPVGPIRLPRKRKVEFVEEFNQLYRGTGMTVEMNGTGDEDPLGQDDPVASEQ